MEFEMYIRTIHDVTAKGTISLYNFTYDILDAAVEGTFYMPVETIKNWFRSDGKNKSYKKIFIDKNFSSIQFYTFLKARTYGTWKTLQTAFREVNHSGIECVVDCETNNHDTFLESLEWQFKTILGIPYIV